MRFKFWAIGIIMLVLILNGCEQRSNNSSHTRLSLHGLEQNQMPPYLSLTATDKTGHNHYYTYQILGGSIKEAAVLKDTAQYPLGVVDLNKDDIFYAEREAGSDQLFQYNMNTKQSMKLTSHLFAINYMIPVKDQVLLAAASQEKNSVQIYSFDLKNNKLVPWFSSSDDDTSVQTMALDSLGKFLYVTLFSADERRMNVRAAEKAQADDVVPAKHRVLKFDLKGNLITEVLSSNDKITEVAISPDSKSVVIKSSDRVFKPRKLTLVDLRTKQEEPLKITNISSIDKICFSPNNKGIYFTGVPKEEEKNTHSVTEAGPPNQLYYYEFKTKKLEKLFSKPDQYINNFILMSAGQ
ncbi:hypothetical protein [Paenibacillus polymyxa]|uniref:hypothetical protein n=1 Tax=Paenibacillus polymyxa TaxID=1406 RepID=UPI0032175736